MGDLTDMFYALSDSLAVAVSSFNPLPLVILSLVVGLFQTKRGHLRFKTLAVTLPALALTSILPFFSGIEPNFPDFYAPEYQIQVLMSLVIAFVIISLLGLVKAALSLTADTVKQDVPNL